VSALVNLQDTFYESTVYIHSRPVFSYAKLAFSESLGLVILVMLQWCICLEWQKLSLGAVLSPTAHNLGIFNVRTLGAEGDVWKCCRYKRL